MVTFNLVFLSIVSIALTAYVSKNKVTKPGVCTRTTGALTTVCNSNCQIDYDCHGIKKCCRVNACSTRCTRPVLVDVGGSGSSTILDTGTMLDTRGSVFDGISRGGHNTISVETSKRTIKTSSSGKRLTHGGSRMDTASLLGNNGRSSSIIEKIGLGRRSDFTDIGSLRGIGSSRGIGGDLMTRLNGGRVSDRSSGSSTFVSKSASAAELVATGHLADDDGLTNNCQYECGIDKQCGNGYVCVQKGCHSNCEVVIKSGISRKMSGQSLHNLETINRPMGGNRAELVGVIGGNQDFSTSRTGIGRGGGSSVMETIEQIRSTIKSGGLSSGIREKHITHGSSIATGHLSGDDGLTSNCQYECGIDKQCGNGYVCVQKGCHSNCEVVIKSGISRKMSGQSLHNLETINRPMGRNRAELVGVIGGNQDFSTSRTGIGRGGGSSVTETIEQIRTTIKSGGLSSGIREKHLTHGSSIATGHLSDDDGLTSNCQNECGIDKQCGNGYVCVQKGCHSNCEVVIKSGISRKMSGQSLHNLETINRPRGGNRAELVGVIGGNQDFSTSRTGIGRGGGSSVTETIEQIRSTIKSGGLSSGIREKHLTHGSSIATGHLSGDDGLTSNCHYECGQDKLCIEGYTCVINGCHSICQVGINSGMDLGVNGQNVGHISNLGRRIGATSLGQFEVIDRTRRVSSQGTVDLQDDTFGRTSGSFIPAVQTGISSNLQKVNNKNKCRKQCHNDADCTINKSCVKVGCHMICRRRQVTNGYT